MEAGSIGSADGATAVYLDSVPGLTGEVGGLAEKAVLGGSTAGFFVCLVIAFLIAA